MARHWVMFVARRGGPAGAPIAASLIAVDPDRRAAWGRYWGCTVEPVSRACTSRPATTSRWPGALPTATQRFEGGAQGEHKMARGLLPVATTVGALAARPAFRAAQWPSSWPAKATASNEYVDELRERNPFKDDAVTRLARLAQRAKWRRLIRPRPGGASCRHAGA